MFDGIKTQYESMKAAKEAASVQYKLAERSYDDAQLKSPLTGFVKDRMVDPGEYVDTMTSGPIFEIIKIDPIKVQFNLPEKYASMVKPGYRFTSKFSSLPGEQYEGLISIVSPAVDQQTRTVMLEGKIDNSKSRIKAGSFAEVVLTIKGSNEALVIPKEAVVSEQGQKYVFKIDGDSVVKTRIKIGSMVNGVEEVIDGLTVDDKIVTDGLNGLYTGAKIEVK
jgi:membrane fusion protein (multidrug efflux system)